MPLIKTNEDWKLSESVLEDNHEDLAGNNENVKDLVIGLFIIILML